MPGLRPDPDLLAAVGATSKGRKGRGEGLLLRKMGGEDRGAKREGRRFPKVKVSTINTF